MSSPQKHPIGKILVALRYASVEQVKEGLLFLKENPDVRLGEALQHLGYCDDIQIARALSKQQNIPFVNLRDFSKIPPHIFALMTPNQVKEHSVVPVLQKNGSITVASPDILEYQVLENLRFIFGCEVHWSITPVSQFGHLAQQVYGLEELLGQAYSARGAGNIDYKSLDDNAEVDAEDDKGIVAQLVQTIISDAISRRSSDIHIEPLEDKLRIRYRIDGNCQEMECPPKRLQGSVISRIKILAGMDIAEKRKPQDGRIKTDYEGRDIDLRVSALPCSHGESIVMRILDKEKNLVSVESLGMDPKDFERFKTMIDKPNGVFLVTGPTGSGKTTTLYAVLQMLNQSDRKIITAEDPVEYNLSGINQSQVNHGIGLNFGKILRSMLRQAPNIILIGEIRDDETANIAIEASLTGHLVFSTLHTNDAPSSLTRLTNMGVKPFLVASAVQGILAQRLVRQLCPHCKREYEPSEQELKMVGLKPEQIGQKKLYEPVGCNKCNGQGYRGRIGVYELLDMDIQLRRLLFEGASTLELRKAAIENGMTTLQADGIRKVLAGLTTIDEILEITHRQDISTSLVA